MKLLYLTTGCFDKGGISRYSRYQIAALREIVGHENVTVLSVLGPDSESFESDIDVAYWAGDASASGKTRFSLRTAQEYFRTRPDVIHSAHVHLSALAAGLADVFGGRTIFNIYGYEVWSGLRRHVRWGFGATDHVVSDCSFTAKWVENAGLRKPGTVAVIRDCVDTSRFSPGRPRREVLARYGVMHPEDALNIVTLGRISRDAEYKGYERLLAVFERLAVVDERLRLVYAGRGDLVEVLRSQAEAMGLGGRVAFTGMIHEDDLVDIYRSSWVFSLISDQGVGRGEGVPLTPLEAGACGVPILVGNQDGSAEAVVEGVNGHILNPFDLDEHLDRLTKLVTNPEERTRMGMAARRRIEEHFSFEVFREAHRRWYSEWFPGQVAPVDGSS